MKILLAFALGLITGALFTIVIIIGLAVSAINKEEDEEIKENYYGEG